MYHEKIFNSIIVVTVPVCDDSGVGGRNSKSVVALPESIKTLLEASKEICNGKSAFNRDSRMSNIC